MTWQKHTDRFVCINDKFSKPIVVYRGENEFINLLKQLLKSISKKIKNKHFKKNLIISEEEQQMFQQNNSCWICRKLIDNENENVRDRCHVTGKSSSAAYWSCNINFQLNKKVCVIFHNLRSYDSHLIFSELNEFDVKISVIPN